MINNSLKSNKFLDPAISRKRELVSNSLSYFNGIPLPSVIEISNSGTCNRSCSFCPRSDPHFSDVKEFIDENLIRKIGSELKQLDFRGVVLFSGFVEPLLHKDIYSHLRLLRNLLPDVNLEIVTNGDVVNRERLVELFDAGLTTLNVSIYDGEEDVQRMQDYANQAGLSDSQLLIRPRYLGADQSFGITLSNRAGLMENAAYKIPSLIGKSLQQPCNYPHYTFFLDYLGDVLLCPHDWGKKLVVGNVRKDSIIDIWMGDSFDNARKMLGIGSRVFSPCDACDVQGTLIGTKHRDAWNQLK